MSINKKNFLKMTALSAATLASLSTFNIASADTITSAEGTNYTIATPPANGASTTDSQIYTATEIDNMIDTMVGTATMTAKDSNGDPATNFVDALNGLEANKANLADVYTKTTADSTFATKTALAAKADASTVYTKTEIDTAIADKANLADVYTKTTADSTFATQTALAAKADASTVYTKTQADTNVAQAKTEAISSAKSYTDATAATTLSNAKTYADNTFATKDQVANLTNNFATKAQVTDLSNRVNRAIAMAAALDFVAPSDNKHLNVIVGSAGYKNQQAVSAGLTLRFNNVLFGVGGSFSGSESLVKGVVSISAF